MKLTRVNLEAKAKAIISEVTFNNEKAREFTMREVTQINKIMQGANGNKMYYLQRLVIGKL